MEKSTLIGLIAGLVILGAALALGQVPLTTLLNPEAILVVFGGTLTATLISFNAETLGKAMSALRESLRHQRLMEPQACVSYVMEVSRFVRYEGILSLQPLLSGVEIPFLRKGLEMVMDNRSEQFIRDRLTTELEVNYREDTEMARVFETAGGFAPTMGIIGAVIGLLHIVQAFDNPAQLGSGVASAFSATLYGLALSNLFLLPMAGKLRQRAREEWFLKTILVEGTLGICAEEHPLLLEEKLQGFLVRENGLSAGHARKAARPDQANYQTDEYDLLNDGFNNQPLGV